MCRSLLALLLLFPFAASAAEPYVGVNLTRVGYDEEGFSTAYPLAVTFKAGAEITPNFAVEGRLATGLTEDEAFGCVPGVGCGSVDLEVDYYYGVYLKGILPVGQIAPYGIFGYTKGELTASAGGVSISEDDNDFSLGLGVDLPLSRTVGFNVEFMQLFNEEDYEINTLSAGVNFRF